MQYSVMLPRRNHFSESQIHLFYLAWLVLLSLISQGVLILNIGNQNSNPEHFSPMPRNNTKFRKQAQAVVPINSHKGQVIYSYFTHKFFSKTNLHLSFSTQNKQCTYLHITPQQPFYAIGVVGIAYKIHKLKTENLSKMVQKDKGNLHQVQKQMLTVTNFRDLKINK